MRRIISIALLLIGTGAVARAQDLPAAKKLTYKKLDSSLAQVVAALDAGRQPRAALRGLNNKLANAATVPVSISTSDVPAVESWLRMAGATVANTGDRVIEAHVTPAHLRGLSSLPDVISVREIVPAAPRGVSQGLVAHGADRYHANGVRGSGVPIGIIDVGFMGLSNVRAGASTLASSNVIGICYRAIGVSTSDLQDCEIDSPHGTAVAETIADLAPGSTLVIANPISLLDFRNAVDQMRLIGVRVINYSVADRWDGPGDGTSPYPDSPLRTVDAAVAQGAVFVAAAGNEARASYFGGFRDANANTWIEFDGANEMNGVFLQAGERIAIQLRWQDTWEAAARDLDLALFNSSGQRVAESAGTQDGSAGRTPFEWISYSASFAGTYYIGINHYSGTVPGWLQLQNFTGQTLRTFTAGGSIASPAETANPGAVAVGAAPWYAPATLESFSSRGPTTDGRVKPDVVGVDRADTVTYPAGFTGTSQAAPHIAALAALLIQEGIQGAGPWPTPQSIVEALKVLAAPGAGPRPSYDWGYGIPVLPAKCVFTVTHNDSLPSAAETILTFSVMTAPGCAWSASSQASFAPVVEGATGTGPGTMRIRVDPNPMRQSRQFSVTVAGKGWVLRQERRFIGGDYDDNGLAELAVFRPSTGHWFVRGVLETTFGGAGDIPLSADFDGDGRTDVAVFRPSTGVWYIKQTFGGTAQYLWGGLGDLPVPGDYDGDGKAEIAIYRPSTSMWYIRTWFGSMISFSLGGNLGSDAIPLPADYDGDGRTDYMTFRPASGEWWLHRSSAGPLPAMSWGGATDTPVPADYDGDGHTDIAVFRPSTGTWYVRLSRGGVREYTWGGTGDVPMPRDYDGDGQADVAVYRPSTGTWFILYSLTGTSGAVTWGERGDLPVSSR